jgi:hypothetical protein
MITSTQRRGERIQAWVPASLAAELKRHAAEERRSVSAAIRIALEDRLRDQPDRDRA